MRLLAILFSLLLLPAAHTAPLTIAVTSNFRATAESITSDFTTATGIAVRISSASTGMLYAQIVHGAPFDVFLAADVERPRLLEASGLGINGSRLTYASGKLALWSGDPGAKDCPKALQELGSARLAIANPETAPYGRAAREFLQAAGYWPAVEANLVYGENVAQTLHFAVTGNARFALVAAAQLIDPRLPAATCEWPVPPDLYAPIEQQAILLRRAQNNSNAVRFLQFLQSAESRATIARSGYGIP